MLIYFRIVNRLQGRDFFWFFVGQFVVVGGSILVLDFLVDHVGVSWKPVEAGSSAPLTPGR